MLAGLRAVQVKAYCQSGGSVVAMMPSGMWAGCGESLHASASDGNHCVYYYNQLYDPSTASLRTISKPAMSDGAGTKKRQCQIKSSQNAQTFDCYLVTPGPNTTEHCPAADCGTNASTGLALSAPFYGLREQRQLSLLDLAATSGLSYRHLIDAEHGSVNVSVLWLRTLANALDLPLTELLDVRT